LVIAADGLGHPSLAEIPAVRTKIASNARVGLGATFAGQTDCYPAGQLTMAVGHGGYAGITQVEAGLLNVAAAVDPHALRQSGSPLNQINNILRGCKLPLIESDLEVRWTGTPALTRHSRQLSQRRLLLVGDAVSYLEPFTGEGMSWAIRSAVLASRLVNESPTMWEDAMSQRWQDQWRKHVASQQTACRTLSSLLKYPRIAKLSLLFASAVPWIPRKIMRQVSGVDESLTVEAFG
jgi:flavin-dependent dehydrogenase